jgi:hypothetical protein
VVDFAFDGADLYLLTTRGAENGKVLRTPLAQASYREATVVVPEGPLVIEGIVLARDGLYVRDLDGGYHTVRKLARSGTLAPVPLAWEGSISGMSASPSEDGLWLDGTGWLLPFSVFRHDPVAGRTERVPLTPPSTLDLASYEAVRLTVTARDGTKVPLSVVAKKGLPRNGRNPALVQAYGSYQISTNPYFSPRNLAFLERGGVLAVAHVRGGGEYGRRWWKGGQKLSKPNTWRDLIDCCEHLIRERWTGKGALTIQGGSAGGITVGMALTERPDLFAGVISNVGVSNALRAEFGQNGPPNIDEFGTVTDADGFKGLRAMDALHHVRDGTRYPAVLLTIGMTDPRVEAWQGAKMVARLQKANRSKHPILLRVSFDAGHGLGSTRARSTTNAPTSSRSRCGARGGVRWRSRSGGGSSSRSGPWRCQAAASSCSRKCVRWRRSAQPAFQASFASRPGRAQHQVVRWHRFARVAGDDRQPQAQHLPGEALLGQRRLHLAQAAALAQHQFADAPLLALREARRVDIGHQVGAVAVVVVVRHHQPHFVQRAGPGQFAAGLGSTSGQACWYSASASAATRPAWAVSTSNRPCRSATDRSRRSPCRALRRACRRWCRSMITPWRSAPLAGFSTLDAELRGQRVQDGQAAADHGLAVGLQRRQVEPVDRAGLDAALHAPAQAFGRDAPSLRPLACSTCATAPAVPLEPSACCHSGRRKVCRASSNSAPAATCAARKPSALKRPSAK